ncbi:MAG: TIGR01777 family protein [Chloroflexi bacterium]|nr:TIGR01777 family protein [Chloroflexota bacterium]
MRIAITGATGFIGRRLCYALAERGDEVIAITRDAVRARRSLPPDTRLLEWRGEPDATLDFDALNVDAVVHLAGESLAGRWSEGRKRAIYGSRVLGTHGLLAGLELAKRRPRLVISGSAIGYYGDRGDERLDEGSAPGNGFLAQVCKGWEAEAVKAEALGVRVVLIRSGIVLGPSGGVLAAMLTPFLLGLGGPMGSGRQWMSWIHLDDEVGLILHAIEREEIMGALNATAPEPVTNREFARSLGAVVRRPAMVPVPASMLRLVLGEASEMVLSSQRVLPARAEATGYRFRWSSLEAALKDCLRR